MPGFTTHYILGVKAYGQLENSGLKHIISKYRWLYQLGLQGPDMFFYNIPILRHRDYRNVGSYMHESHVNDFFANAMYEIQSMESAQKKQQAISYIAGFLCHYVGDYICHPYVYARIGHETGKNSAYVYGMHAALENDIDTLLLLKYKKKKTSEFNQAATLALNGFEIQFVSDFLARVINKTYYPITYKNNFRVTPAMVHRSVLAMRFGVRTLADPTGRKKNRINAIENIFLKAPIVSQKILSDDIPDVITKLRVIYKNIMKLDYDNQRTRKSSEINLINAVDSMSPLELFDTFYEIQNGNHLSDAQRVFLENIIEGVWK